MDIIFIIYIFALFIIFTPNFILQISYKQNNVIATVMHAIIFSLVFFITYKIVQESQKEGAKIGTYQRNDETYNLEVPNLNLGGLKMEESETKKPKTVYDNEVVAVSQDDAELSKLTKSTPYDYVNFRNYDYETMQKRIALLESHQHSNQYFDLVPNFNKEQHEVLCAADYGTNTPCCRQPNAYIPDDHVCGPLKPYCTEYIDGVQWGKCVANNPHPKPTLQSKAPASSNVPTLSNAPAPINAPIVSNAPAPNTT